MTDRHKPTGITRLIRAFGYSLQGFAHSWRGEAAFRQEVLLSVVVIPAGWYLGAPASSGHCWSARCC